jgi:hypothetical protein
VLTAEDAPTIRHAITRRLDTERGVAVREVKVEPHPDEVPAFIAVGVLAELDGRLVADAVFHLPSEFELAHLHNEIDEIAEGFKSARIDAALSGLPAVGAMRRLLGTGLRGGWAAYGD